VDHEIKIHDGSVAQVKSLRIKVDGKDMLFYPMRDGAITPAAPHSSRNWTSTITGWRASMCMARLPGLHSLAGTRVWRMR